MLLALAPKAAELDAALVHAYAQVCASLPVMYSDTAQKEEYLSHIRQLKYLAYTGAHVRQRRVTSYLKRPIWSHYLARLKLGPSRPMSSILKIGYTSSQTGPRVPEPVRACGGKRERPTPTIDPSTNAFFNIPDLREYLTGDLYSPHMKKRISGATKVDEMTLLN